MMDYTDRHCRYFLRQISRRTLLYTEMVTTAAILRGGQGLCPEHRQKLLGFSLEEKPVALQLGGDDPADLAECAKIGEDWGYDEINLNVGCPSDRVQNGHFGACLMARPQRVADCVLQMRQAVSIPVTVKHRIGIDDRDRYEDLAEFVRIVAEAGCQRFTVHARKAWLSGLSPKENRTIPPLRYDLVYRLKQEFPEYCIEINGGITTLEQIKEHLNLLDAAMIGRAAYDNPYLLASVDQEIYGEDLNTPTRSEIVGRMLPYIDQWVHQGLKLHTISRHLLNLFRGQARNRAWKRYISENACLPDAGVKTIETALEKMLL